MDEPTRRRWDSIARGLGMPAGSPIKEIQAASTRMWWDSLPREARGA